MKVANTVLVMALAVPAGASAQAGGGATTSPRVVVAEIVARVNNDIITRFDLEQSQQQTRRELTQQHSGAELDRRYEEEARDLLRDLIDQLLLVQRAKDMGVSVESELIKRLDRVRQEAGVGSLEELERVVAAQGLDYEEWRNRLRNQMLSQMVVQREVTGRIMLSSDELRRYYLEHREELRRPESWRLREILVSTEGVAAEGLPAREDRVREALEKIRKGEKFEEVAKSYSDSPTAANGGDLGYFEPDKLSFGIREGLAELRESGVSNPLRTREGFLILQLVERNPAGIPTFERAEDDIREKLFLERVQPALREFLKKLRLEAFVEVKAGHVDTGAVQKPAKPVIRGKRRRKRS